jgi:hypothetical protein
MDKKLERKPYERPVVKKVKLEIKNAILVVCNSSANTDPQGFTGCKIDFGGCYS